MRNRVNTAGVTVHAVAGTHVVTLGLDLSATKRKGCLGFAIQREDSLDNERLWLRGMKTFEETDPGLGAGSNAPTNEHPVQSFQWADYSAKPGVSYTYTVVPMYGTPTQLTEGTHVPVPIQAEEEEGAIHTVYFNRGSAASQEYGRRFGQRSPQDVGAPAYEWLSRGLFEALQAFVARAKNSTFGLRGAIYELQWPAALQAFKDAKKRSADVKVLYDGIKESPGDDNAEAVSDAGIGSFCKPRTTGKLMHNKFIVLTKNGKPVSVWTGSTNLKENGIFGHCNVGHIVEDKDVAAEYLAYWEELRTNPEAADERDWMATNNPNPPTPRVPPAKGTSVVFSPRSGTDVLDWYAELAGYAARNAPRGGLFMTFAFGMDKRFQQVYEQPDGVLRMALMDKEGNGAGMAQGKIDVARIRKLPNVVVALGRSIVMNSFDRWLKERDKQNPSAGVKYVHNKFMLNDPLGPDPIVVTGSANFSAASTNANQENMLVIRGDTRAADIYLGEFMRVFSHYSFREAVANFNDRVKRARAAGQPVPEWRPQFLSPDDSWQKDYFTPGDQRYLRREYFAG